MSSLPQSTNDFHFDPATLSVLDTDAPSAEAEGKIAVTAFDIETHDWLRRRTSSETVCPFGFRCKEHDLENYKYARITQIAWVSYTAEGRLLYRESYYISDIETISTKATKYTDITKEICQEQGVPLQEALIKLNTIIQKTVSDGGVLTAHNLVFDLNITTFEMERIGGDVYSEWSKALQVLKENRKLQCTLEMSRKKTGNARKSNKLTKAYERFFGCPCVDTPVDSDMDKTNLDDATTKNTTKILKKQNHEATYDAELCARLYLWFTKYGNRVTSDGSSSNGATSTTELSSQNDLTSSAGSISKFTKGKYTGLTFEQVYEKRVAQNEWYKNQLVSHWEDGGWKGPKTDEWNRFRNYVIEQMMIEKEDGNKIMKEEEGNQTGGREGTSSSTGTTGKEMNNGENDEEETFELKKKKNDNDKRDDIANRANNDDSAVGDANMVNDEDKKAYDGTITDGGGERAVRDGPWTVLGQTNNIFTPSPNFLLGLGLGLSIGLGLGLALRAKIRIDIT